MSEFGGPSYGSLTAKAAAVFEQVQSLVQERSGASGPGFGAASRWRDDALLHQALNNIKAAAQGLAMTCSKLSLLASKSPSPEALASLLGEFEANLDSVALVFTHLTDCSVSAPLFDMISVGVRSQLVRSKEVLEMASGRDFDGLSNAASVVFKLYDQIQDLPMTNKAAYRRFAMEKLAIVKDTMREFQAYVDAAAAATPTNSAAADNEDEDEDEEEDDEPYTFEEASVVQTCLRIMDSASLLLKAALAIMTQVADALTPNAAVGEQERAACEAWVGALCLLIKQCEGNVTNLGAELYAPFDHDQIRRYRDELSSTLSQLARDLADERFGGHLSDASRAMIADVEASRVAADLASVNLN